MKRPCKKPKGPHVRRAIAELRRLGATQILLEVNSHYFLSWTFGRVRMCINMALSASRSGFEAAWSAIRAQFRKHKLVVPA